MQPGDRDVRDAGQSVVARERARAAHAAVPGAVAARDCAVRRHRRSPGIQTRSRRAAQALFDPGRPWSRVAMVLATLGLVRAPTPETREAAKLRAIAEEIAKTSPEFRRQGAGRHDSRGGRRAGKSQAAAGRENEAARRCDARRRNAPPRSATTTSRERIRQPANPARRTEKATARARARATRQAMAAARARARREPARTLAATTRVRARAAAAIIRARTKGGNGSANNDKNDQNKSNASNIAAAERTRQGRNAGRDR